MYQGKEERTTENNMELHMSTSHEKYWAERGRGDGHGDVEMGDLQPYWRPYILVRAGGK